MHLVRVRRSGGVLLDAPGPLAVCSVGALPLAAWLLVAQLAFDAAPLSSCCRESQRSRLATRAAGSVASALTNRARRRVRARFADGEPGSCRRSCRRRAPAGGDRQRRDRRLHDQGADCGRGDGRGVPRDADAARARRRAQAHPAATARAIARTAAGSSTRPTASARDLASERHPVSMPVKPTACCSSRWHSWTVATCVSRCATSSCSARHTRSASSTGSRAPSTPPMRKRAASRCQAREHPHPGPLA